MTVKTINFILSTLRGISGADDVAASVLGAGGWSVSEDGSLEGLGAAVEEVVEEEEEDEEEEEEEEDEEEEEADFAEEAAC